MTTTTKPLPLLIWRLFFHDGMNKLNAAMLSSELALITQESQHFEEIEQSLQGMESLMKLYNQFMRIDHTASIRCSKVIDEVNDMLGKPGEDIEISVNGLTETKINPIFIAIFYNLIQNSILHSGQENGLVVTIEIKESQIVFSDNGKGIKKKGDDLFAPGHALGIIRELGKKLGFTIKASNNPEGGARFSIQFIQLLSIGFKINLNSASFFIF
jgi:signal transduction histidine kinase